MDNHVWKPEWYIISGLKASHMNIYRPWEKFSQNLEQFPHFATAQPHILTIFMVIDGTDIEH